MEVKQGDYFMEGILEYRNKCYFFGNPDGMTGSCVDCSYERNDLWERCMESSRIILGKKKKSK
jgi:hypothetical protein